MAGLYSYMLSSLIFKYNMVMVLVEGWDFNAWIQISVEFSFVFDGYLIFLTSGLVEHLYLNTTIGFKGFLWDRAYD